MKVSQALSVAALGLATVVQAHMEMSYPPPFKSKFNPFSGSDIDYSMTSPLDASGDNYPCKGYQKLLGTAEGKSVVDWQAGKEYNMSITGGASHNGGSCQASLSYDKGSTWTVIHSFIGNCPVTGDSSYKFTLPNDTPAGKDVLFAWTWFNNVGNREMYMNCASITITGGSNNKVKRDPSDPFKGRPSLFVANVGNGCGTVEGKDVMFPDPGPDVTKVGDNTAPPTGKCASSAGGSGGGSGGGSSGGSSGGSDPAPSSPADASSPAAPSPPAATSSPADEPSSNQSVPGGVFVTSGGQALPSNAPAPPSTMLTVTTSAAADTPPAGTPPATPPATPPSNPSPSTPAQPVPTPGGGGSGGGAGSHPPGTACTVEGNWNCVGGSQYQRCASGAWSVMMPMAAGTTCTPGESTNLVMIKKRRGVRRAEPWRV